MEPQEKEIYIRFLSSFLTSTAVSGGSSNVSVLAHPPLCGVDNCSVPRAALPHPQSALQGYLPALSCTHLCSKGETAESRKQNLW